MPGRWGVRSLCITGGGHFVNKTFAEWACFGRFSAVEKRLKTPVSVKKYGKNGKKCGKIDRLFPTCQVGEGVWKGGIYKGRKKRGKWKRIK